MKHLTEIFDEASPRETEELLRGIESDPPDKLTDARIRKAVLSGAAPGAKAKKPRRTLFVGLAAAAAALMLAAAILAAVKLKSRPDPNVTAHATDPAGTETAEPSAAPVPTDTAKPDVTAGPTQDPDNAFMLADAVCWVTVGERLSETREHSYYKAKVGRTFKGEVPESIVLCQPEDMGSALHASGQCLVYVKRWHSSESAGFEDVYYVLDKSYAEFTPVTPLIPYGKAEDEIGMDLDAEPVGPEDMFIDGDTVVILDSLNHSIKVFDKDGLVRSIAVPGGYCMAMARLDDLVYVFDYTLGRIYEIDWITGEKLREAPFPEGTDVNHISQMTSDGQTVWLWDINYLMHDLASGETKRIISVRSSGSSVYWKTEFMESEHAFYGKFTSFIGCDGEKNSYFTLFDPIWDAPLIIGEFTLRKYSPEGELIGIARLPMEDYVFAGSHAVKLAPDGSAYHIACEEDGVRVYLVKLGTEYESKMEELIERAAELAAGQNANEICFRDTIIDDASNEPEDFQVMSEDLYVLNSSAENVLRFNMDGELIETFPFPVHMDSVTRFLVGRNGLYLIDVTSGTLHVFDPYTLEDRAIELPLHRDRTDPNDRFDSGQWFSGEGFAGSIILMYESGNNLVLVLRESYGLISSFVYDPAAGSVIRTEEYGYSGTVGGRCESRISLRRAETGAELEFDLGEWTFVKLLGSDEEGCIYVETIKMTDNGPVPRRVFKIGADGSVKGASAETESEGFIAFTLSDEGRVYAMYRKGERVNVWLMSME